MTRPFSFASVSRCKALRQTGRLAGWLLSGYILDPYKTGYTFATDEARRRSSFASGDHPNSQANHPCLYPGHYSAFGNPFHPLAERRVRLHNNTDS